MNDSDDRKSVFTVVFHCQLSIINCWVGAGQELGGYYNHTRQTRLPLGMTVATVASENDTPYLNHGGNGQMRTTHGLPLQTVGSFSLE